MQLFSFRKNQTNRSLVDLTQEDNLRTSGWDPTKQNIVFIHGYAGGDGVFPAVIVRDGMCNTFYYYCVIYLNYCKIRPSVCEFESLQQTKMFLSFFVVTIAYIKNGSYNVFVVDWGPLATTPCYPAAVHNLKIVARCTAMLYNFIRDTGVPSSSITCVGHSLGAHACGLISDYLLFRMQRIIGKSCILACNETTR